MNRGKVLAVLVVILLVAGMLVPGAGAAGGVGMAQTQDVDPDSVLISIDVQPNGTAVWQIEYRVRLSTENETAAYEDLVADVEANTSEYVDRFATRMNATVDDAENYTGRDMSSRDFDVSADIQEFAQTYGVLTYTFVWEGFGATEDDTIRVGDALEGFFLDSETTLLIAWPDSYAATSISPAPTDERENAVSWDGPLDFVDGEPRVVLEPAASTTQPPGETTTPVDRGTGIAWLLVAGVFGVLVLLGLAAVWYMRREDDAEPETATTSEPSGEGPPPATGTAVPEGEEEGAPEALLSNEERVTRFLEAHGGRVKQQEIVDGLEWTEAKTSQVLSSMAEEGTVEKFRIGRENVVKLPDDSEDEGL